MHFARFVVSCAAAAAAVSPASAQLPVTARALGMGGAYTAVARGQEAIFHNPANLALPGNPHTSLAAPQITVGATINGLTFGDVDALRDFDELTDEQRADILGRIPEEGTTAEVDLRIPVLSMSYRRAMFGVSYNITGRHAVARDLAELVLVGVQRSRLIPGNSNPYDLADIGNRTQGYRAAYVDFAAGYAHRVGPVSLGVTGHYLNGRALVRSGVVRVRSEISATEQDVQVTYMGVRREGATGFGLDVGAAIQPIPSLTLSAAVTNAVNTLEWKGEQEIRQIVLDRDDYVNSDPERLRDEYGSSAVSLGAATSDARALAQGLLTDLDVGAELAPTLRAGAAWQPRPGTSVAASYTGELSDSRLAGPWNRSLSIGWQQKVPSSPCAPASPATWTAARSWAAASRWARFTWAPPASAAAPRATPTRAAGSSPSASPARPRAR